MIARLPSGCAHGLDHLVSAIQRVVRRRCDVRPVRFDIRQVQAPRLRALLGDEVDGAVGGVDGFRMQFGDTCWQVGVAHFPATEDFAVCTFASVGPVVPGVTAFVAKAAQVMGVRRRVALVVKQRIIREDPVVTKVRLEADFIQRCSLLAGRVDGQPLQGVDVRRGVGFADQRGANAVGAQVVADSQLFQR